MVLELSPVCADLRFKRDFRWPGRAFARLWVDLGCRYVRILFSGETPFAIWFGGVIDEEIGKGKDVESDGDGICEGRFRHQHVKNNTRF